MYPREIGYPVAASTFSETPGGQAQLGEIGARQSVALVFSNSLTVQRPGSVQHVERPAEVESGELVARLIIDVGVLAPVVADSAE